MSDDDTLGQLIRFSRYTLTERRLCCPDCGSDIELLGGVYRCTRSDGGACHAEGFATLSELAVKK